MGSGKPYGLNMAEMLPKKGSDLLSGIPITPNTQDLPILIDNSLHLNPHVEISIIRINPPGGS